jgi:hypothetical protein
VRGGASLDDREREGELKWQGKRTVVSERSIVKDGERDFLQAKSTKRGREVLGVKRG